MKYFLLLLPMMAIAAPKRPVLAPVDALKWAGVAPVDAAAGVGLAWVTDAEEQKLSDRSHDLGKCGGYERLPEVSVSDARKIVRDLAKRVQKENSVLGKKGIGVGRPRQERIAKAVEKLSEQNLRSHVEWLSSYPDRYNKSAEPNRHVAALEGKLRELLKNYVGPWTIEQVAHQSTRQKSLRLRLEGASRPQEIVVLGGHLDSIASRWGGGGGRAPGADDNASGSSNVIEALRVIAGEGRPERTIEFYWYAGEESGLLGSAEIAEAYRAAGKDVVAVLQLDMTLQPGAGELVIGNVTDFTSAWLRSWLEDANSKYVGARLIADECGYGCSDHASWFRRGYPTLLPFESDTSRMNRNIHTDRDVIDGVSNFRHSLAFSKIAVAFALDLGNSEERAPQ